MKVTLPLLTLLSSTTAFRIGGPGGPSRVNGPPFGIGWWGNNQGSAGSTTGRPRPSAPGHWGSGACTSDACADALTNTAENGNQLATASADCSSFFDHVKTKAISITTTTTVTICSSSPVETTTSSSITVEPTTDSFTTSPNEPTSIASSTTASPILPRRGPWGGNEDWSHGWWSNSNAPSLPAYASTCAPGRFASACSCLGATPSWTWTARPTWSTTVVATSTATVSAC